jgi:predicted Ser/Thr protein kinase
MEDNYNLLTRLLVGVLKHQVKRYLGEGVVSALMEAGSEHLGERLLDVLKGEQSSREQAKRLATALKSAADELEREQLGLYLRLEDVPAEMVEPVVEALANLESGDLQGRRLQGAIQDLVGSISETDADNRRRISMQLYQVVLMAVLTIPELQPRAQDLLQQSRTWLLSEQMRGIELMAKQREQTALPAVTTRAAPSLTSDKAITALRTEFGEDGAAQGVNLRAGLVLANGTVELLELVGEGGQASVWRGRLLATGDPVAVRFLHQDLTEQPEIVRSFEREVDVLRGLSGKAIPQLVKPLIYEDGRYFYVVEYVENATSFANIIKSSEVPVARKIRAITDVAEVLHTMHQQGFIHGDVKPQNIIIDGRDSVRLIDFGSARKIGQRDIEEPITFTYKYVAPELLALHPTIDEPNDTSHSGTQVSRIKLRMKTEVGPALDIYPLGIMLFHALDPGLAARGYASALVGQLLVRSDMKAVIRKATALKAADRFESALEFKLAVEAAVTAATADEPNLAT